MVYYDKGGPLIDASNYLPPTGWDTTPNDKDDSPPPSPTPIYAPYSST